MYVFLIQFYYKHINTQRARLGEGDTECCQVRSFIRDLAIFEISWDVFGIFIFKTQTRDFFGLFQIMVKLSIENGIWVGG